MKSKSVASVLAAALAATLSASAIADTVQGVGPKATAASKAGISTEQRALLSQKLEAIGRIMQAAEMENVQGAIAQERRRWMLESLYKMSLADVQAVGMPGSADALANAIASNKAIKQKREGPAFGTNDTELVYIPITPCRFIDTRFVGGPLAGPRGFDLDLTGSTYGGDATCDPSATVGGNANRIGAVSLNAAIIGPTGAPGFIGARPFGATTTTALVNWYEAGPTVQASNAGVVTTDQSGAASEIEFFGSATNFVVDIFGIFAAPTATALQCVNVFNASNSTLAPESFTQFVDADIVACPATYAAVGFVWDFVGGSGGMAPWENHPEDSGVVLGFTHTRPSSASLGTTITFTPGRRCCRIPGR
jgi:hypothetical protein